MCGITGIYHFDDRSVERRCIQAMNDVLIHRGPDGEGTWVKGGIGLGHRRLSIIDLESGRQPMATEDDSVQVVFNGEIYNFLELKAELEKRGYRFRTRSDTESILYAYLEWGEDFVQHLRGMFAIGLWDDRKRKLVLARDRVGKKPLYYYRDRNRLAFASELKALLTIPEIPRDLNAEALDAYCSFGYVPSPLTIFQNIWKLPPGHVGVCTPEAFSTRQYWHLDMNGSDGHRSTEEAVEQVEAIFDEAVKLRLISDVPLGAFLSGGVDSSAVVASMAQIISPKPVRTASIGFQEKKFDELDYSRMVAERYKTDHSEFVVRPDAPTVLNRIVWHLDEPFADSSVIPTYYVSQLARRVVTVALSGDGGDEVFAGYVQRYHMNRLEDRTRRSIPQSLRRNMLGLAARLYPKADFLPRPLRLKSFLTNLSMSLEEAYFRDMSFYFLPEMKRKLYRPELTAALDEQSVLDVLGRHFAANRNSDVTTRIQYVDIKTYLPEDILVKVDRMSMAHSLEVRAPILDHKLIELVGKMSSKLKLNGSSSKYIFKKMNEKRLPNEVLYRRKQGFCVPLASWLRGELRGVAHETLFSGSSRLKDYFEMSYIDNLWRAHLSGRHDRAAQLWNLMMFELWRKTFLE